MRENNLIDELDEQDVELKKIMGERFVDATEAPKAKKPAKKTPVDADYEMLEEPSKPQFDYMKKLKGCAKSTLLYGGLFVLFFYWQQTGEMAATAALPSMCACCGLAGFGIGKVMGGK